MIWNDVSFRKKLEQTFDKVLDVDQLPLLPGPGLGVAFKKMSCWLLEQYSECVFLDSDCLVIRSIDDLFKSEEFSAAPDAGWPACLNSGVFVYKPSEKTFHKK